MKSFHIENLDTKKRMRGEEFEDAAAADEWLGDTTTDTTGTISDATTDSTTPGSQTLAPSVDADIMQRIDPRLLTDEPTGAGEKAEVTGMGGQCTAIFGDQNMSILVPCRFRIVCSCLIILCNL